MLKRFKSWLRMEKPYKRGEPTALQLLDMAAAMRRRAMVLERRAYTVLGLSYPGS